MLTVGGFAQLCNSPYLLTTHQPNAVSFPQQTHLQFFSNASFFKVRSGLRAFALKKKRKGKGSILEVNQFDDIDDINYADEEEEEEDDDDDDEGMLLPLENMKKWLENKPGGFGEGKDYDTSVEDKLLEELEQSREAQLANINKLKNNPLLPTPKGKVHQQQKEPEAIQSGIRVRLFGLPKKKNIHRDLQSAFKGVPGILNVIPVVSGNKRTREPVCKGFAFVDFKSVDDANRFVQIFSKQNVAFGKVQKQIKCEIITLQSPKAAIKQSVEDTYANSEGDIVADIDMDNSSFQSLEEDLFDELDDLDDEFGTEELEIIQENEESSSASGINHGDSMMPKMDSATDSLSSNRRQKHQGVKKKPSTKTKGEKRTKLNIPGSANRLKIKEKALLTGVFSKYAAKVGSTSSRDN